MNEVNTDVIQILPYSNSCYFNENEAMVYINSVLEISF